MTRILVLQHVAHEILGTLNPLIKEFGFRIKYVNFERDPTAQPSIEALDGMIILGGPMNVDQVAEFPHLAHETKLVQEAIRKDIPVLGICLGAQLIARALGAEVYAAPQKEIGWYSIRLTPEGLQDPILDLFSENEDVFQWHGDTFSPPPGAAILASSTICPNQAFRYGDRVYGFQFHLEVDEPMINRWLTIPCNILELASLGDGICERRIKRETSLYINRLKQLAELSFTEFLNLVGKPSKARGLGSR